MATENLPPPDDLNQLKFLHHWTTPRVYPILRLVQDHDNHDTFIDDLQGQLFPFDPEYPEAA